MGKKCTKYEKEKRIPQFLRLVPLSPTIRPVSLIAIIFRIGEGTVIDSAYLESIPSHGDLETLYRANFWYVMLYVSAMCPNFKRLMAEISKAAK